MHGTSVLHMIKVNDYKDKDAWGTLMNIPGKVPRSVLRKECLPTLISMLCKLRKDGYCTCVSDLYFMNL